MNFIMPLIFIKIHIYNQYSLFLRASDSVLLQKMSFQPAKLDVDPTILDSNLMVVDQPNDPFSSLFPSPPRQKKGLETLQTLLPGAQYDTTMVVPKPGMCVKTKNAAGTKFFINLCKLSEIPAPPPIEESELSRIISSEDYTSPWRVPMSLGTPRKEKDKSGIAFIDF